jgi:hypothetical protein
MAATGRQGWLAAEIRAKGNKVRFCGLKRLVEGRFRENLMNKE